MSHFSGNNFRQNFNHNGDRDNLRYHQYRRQTTEPVLAAAINFSEEIAPKRLTLREKYLRRTEWLLKTKNELMTKMMIKQEEIKNDPSYNEEKKIEFSGLLLTLDKEIILLERDRIRYMREQAEDQINEVAKAVYNSSRSSSPYNNEDEREQYCRSGSRQTSSHREVEPDERRSRERNYRHSQRERSRSRQKQSSEKIHSHQSRNIKQSHSGSLQKRDPDSHTSTHNDYSYLTRTVNIVQNTPNPVYFQPESNSLKMVPNLKVKVDSFNSSLLEPSVVAEENKFIDNNKISSSQYGKQCRSPNGNKNFGQNEHAANELFIDSTSKLSQKFQRINYPELEATNSRPSLSQPTFYKSTFSRDETTFLEETATDDTIVITQQSDIPSRVLDKNRLWFDEECLIVARSHHIARKLYKKNQNNSNFKDYTAKKNKMDNLFREKFKTFQRKNQPTATIVTQKQNNTDNVDEKISYNVLPIKNPSKTQKNIQQDEMANEPWYDKECDTLYKLKCEAWDICQIYETNSNKKNYERCRQMVQSLFQKKATEYHETQAIAASSTTQIVINVKGKTVNDDDLWYDTHCQDAEYAMRIALEIYEKNENEDNLEVFNIRKRQCEKLFQRKRQTFLDQLKSSEDINHYPQGDDSDYDGNPMLDNEENCNNWQVPDHDDQEQQRMITPPPPKLSQSDFEMFNSSSGNQSSSRQSTNYSSLHGFSQFKSTSSKSVKKTNNYDRKEETFNKLPYNNYGSSLRLIEQQTSVQKQKFQPKWQSSFKEVIDPNSFDIAAKSMKTSTLVKSAPKQSTAIEQKQQPFGKITTQATNGRVDNRDELTKNWQKFVKTMQYVSPQYQNDDIESKKQHERYMVSGDARTGDKATKSDSHYGKSSSSYRGHHNAK